MCSLGPHSARRGIHHEFPVSGPIRGRNTGLPSVTPDGVCPRILRPARRTGGRMRAAVPRARAALPPLSRAHRASREPLRAERHWVEGINGMNLELNRTALAVAHAVAAISLAACGGGSSPSASPATTGTAATDAPAMSLDAVAEKVNWSRLDKQAPTVAITSVSSVSASKTVDITGTAGDNMQLVKVTWANSTGGSGTATLSGSSTQATWKAAAVAV